MSAAGNHNRSNGLKEGARAMAPRLIVILPYAEKPDDPKDPNLSSAGETRAKMLATVIPKRFCPDFLFATAPTDNNSRPITTLAPTALALGLTLNTSFQDLEYASLARNLLSDPRYDDKTCIICWNHHHIPDLAIALGVEPPKIAHAPGVRSRLDLDPSDFDFFWVLTRVDGRFDLAVSRQEEVGVGDWEGPKERSTEKDAEHGAFNTDTDGIATIIVSYFATGRATLDTAELSLSAAYGRLSPWRRFSRSATRLAPYLILLGLVAGTNPLIQASAVGRIGAFLGSGSFISSAFAQPTTGSGGYLHGAFSIIFLGLFVAAFAVTLFDEFFRDKPRPISRDLNRAFIGFVISEVARLANS
jgi:hypothetical protein